MSEIDSPACPHCGSLRVTAILIPNIITGGPVSTLQTHDYVWQCICGTVFTVAEIRSADNPAASELPFVDQLRRNKPR